MLTSSDSDRLRVAGFAESDIADWAASRPGALGDYESDQRRHSQFWTRCEDLVRRLPERPARNQAEALAAQTIFVTGRDHRERFLSVHAATIYDKLTRNRTLFLRIDDLLRGAAALVPGLTPATETLRAENSRALREKEGIECDQGIFLAHMLGNERAGAHLCHAMLLPRPEALDLLPMLEAQGQIDLGGAAVERSGKAIGVIMQNPRFLNAEDQTTIDALEIAVDLATLDRRTPVAVLRGGMLAHPKYRGRRVFGAGINLTRLYRGELPFAWFLTRDLGFVHKFLRGVAHPEAVPDDVNGHAVEKPWIAALDGFAIGGACQILLTMDYTVAASDAFMSLPARKEGIIPGLANLRLPRFTADRIARQAIQSERKLACDSAEGRMICDEIVPAGQMDEAIKRVVDALASAGSVSTVANRRALRVGQEPLDLFRRYCAAYARDQAYCYASPALIANLEQNWDAKDRRI